MCVGAPDVEKSKNKDEISGKEEQPKRGKEESKAASR
jgi:hypothetical protein